MARFTVLALASVTALSAVFVACGGGSDGEAIETNGSSGGSGKAGSTAKAGSGGASGSTGGQAGSAAAGAAGSTGGKAGAAGSTGGAAGKAGASGGSGASGASGAGVCGPTTMDCNNNTADGCETTVSTDPVNCGTCGKKCAGGTNADPSCKAGLCFLQCKTGFSDCNKDEKDGCEITTNTDVNNCGKCGTKCAPGPNGTAGCFDGVCGLTCMGTFQDCDKIPANGCEADLKTDTKNCGGCGVTCPMGGSCVNGGCECAGTTAEAQLIPLDMYVMFDKSGSMSGTKWDNATAAMKSFVNDPGSKGMGVGIDFFPSGSACSVASYSAPTVGIAALPGNATALVNAINAESPDGANTPTTPALQGAIDYAKQNAVANPTHKTIVVFVTDGEPNGCSSSVGNAATTAQGGFNGSPSIPTYVVGVGSSLTNLNQIAAGGGTTSAILVNGGDAAAFLAAMKAIQGKSLGCEYTLPAPPPGMSFDPAKVNVKLTLTGKPATTLSQVANAAACTANGGWYYDVPAAPTKILLCPATCTTVKGDANAKVEVELGCSTKKD